MEPSADGVMVVDLGHPGDPERFPARAWPEPVGLLSYQRSLFIVRRSPVA